MVRRVERGPHCGQMRASSNSSVEAESMEARHPTCWHHPAPDGTGHPRCNGGSSCLHPGHGQLSEVSISAMMSATLATPCRRFSTAYSIAENTRTISYYCRRRGKDGWCHGSIQRGYNRFSANAKTTSTWYVRAAQYCPILALSLRCRAAYEYDAGQSGKHCEWTWTHSER